MGWMHAEAMLCFSDGGGMLYDKDVEVGVLFGSAKCAFIIDFFLSFGGRGSGQHPPRGYPDKKGGNRLRWPLSNGIAVFVSSS